MRTRRTELAALLAAGGLIAAVATPTPVTAAPADPATGPTTGPAIATSGNAQLVRQGDTIVVRGTSFVGPRTGDAALLDPATGTATGTAAVVDGEVDASIPDGTGGWYVAGEFSRVGGQERSGVVHLDATGALDPTFDVDAIGVTAMALSGDTIYLGGEFFGVGPVGRPAVAAVSATTGALRRTFHVAVSDDPDAYFEVYGLVTVPAAEGRTARLVAAITTDYYEDYRQGGKPAGRAAVDHELRALDPVTGADVPGFSNTLSGVRSVVLGPDDRLYAGGHGLSAVDATTGSTDPDFHPNVGSGGPTSLVADDERLYAAGNFDSLGGVNGPLVAIDPETGLPDHGFAPALGRNELVTSLAVGSDGDLWVTGRRSIGGAGRGSVRHLDRTDGSALPGPLPTFHNTVDTASLSGGAVLLGGGFWTIGETPTTGDLVTLDARTLETESIGDGHPGTRGELIDGGDVLFLAETHFHERYARSDVLALEPGTGRTLDRLSHLDVENLTGVAVTPTRLYLVQAIVAGRRSTNRVTVYNTSTGARTDRFDLPIRGRVSQVLTGPGALYFVGGFAGRAAGRPFRTEVLETSRSGTLRSGFHTDLRGAVKHPDDGPTTATDATVGGNRLYVTVQRGDFSGALTAVRLRDGRRIGSFHPAQPCFVVDQCRSAVIDGDLYTYDPEVSLNGGGQVVDARTGAVDSLAAAGLAATMYGVTQVPAGVVVASIVDEYVYGAYDPETQLVIAP